MINDFTTLNVIELVTGQKLISKLKIEDSCFILNDVLSLVQNMQGGFSLIPYAPFASVSDDIKIEKSHVITTYKLSDEHLKAAHSKAWNDFKEKKLGLKLT
jgi:hypothetical protein